MSGQDNVESNRWDRDIMADNNTLENAVIEEVFDEVDNRREALKKLGKFAAYTAPAMALLLTADPSSGAAPCCSVKQVNGCKCGAANGCGCGDALCSNCVSCKGLCTCTGGFCAEDASACNPSC